MPTLSLVMIVRNEAERLPDCLASVQEIADEIIIGDTGSTDATVEVARRYGAQVFPVPWEDDFAKARNRVLAEAGGDWLLHLDADEVVDTVSAQRIRAWVDADGYGADAVVVTIANYCNNPRAWRWVPCNPHDPYTKGFHGYLETQVIRLFRNRRGFEYRERIHENLAASVMEKGGRIRVEAIRIHHYGYDESAYQGGHKGDLYFRLAKRKMEEHPTDVKVLQDFAEQALAVGHRKEAVEACLQILALDPTNVSACMTLANLYLIDNRRSEARALLLGLEQAGVLLAHQQLALAAIAYHEGDAIQASDYLDRAETLQPGNPLVHLYRARIYDLQGNPQAAYASLQHAYTLLPSLPEIEKRLTAHKEREYGERCYTGGKITEALQAFTRALREDPDDPVLYNDIGVVYTALGRKDEALTFFQKALSICAGFAPARENASCLRSEKTS